jgi:hypothetical protein
MPPALAARLFATMKKPELLIRVTPSGDPLLKGSCSTCSDVTFAYVGDTDENRRLMQLAFERHVREKHMREDTNQSGSPIIPRA